MFLANAWGYRTAARIRCGGADPFRRGKKRNAIPTREDRTMLEWLEFTPLALWVKESWGWPFALTLHAFGSAVIVGFAFIMCLRLFGMFQTIPLSSLMSLIPYIWVCVVLQVSSGFLLWLTKPGTYLKAGVFDVKLALIVTGVVTTMYFQRTLSEEAGRWDSSGTISARGIKFVAATALIWALVLIAGRLTAYLGIYVTAVTR
jgi:hypothetical protein